MSFPRYPEYKDSGVDWLGEVPAHWDVAPIKKVVALIESGVSVNSVDTPAVGDEPGVLKTSCVYAGKFDSTENKAVVPDEHYRVACPVVANTLIVSRMNTPDLVGAAGLVSSTNAKLFLPDRLWQVHFRDAETNYIYYWTRTPSYRAQVEVACAGTSSSMQNLSQDAFRGFLLPLPHFAEQAAIGRFLDRETAKIDALVEEQQRLIELLKEKRQAVISQAVTKGLDPNVPMKDSGVEWLGKVPEHWDTGSLIRIADRIVVGIAEAATHAYADEGIAILRSTNIRAGRIIGEILFVTREFAEGRATKLMSAGDLVTVRTGNAGVTAVVPSELDGCQCFTMLITTLRGHELPAFYCYALNSLPSQRYFSLEGWGTAQVNISVPILKALPVTIPPISEQRAIVAYLDDATAKFDGLISEAETAMRLLDERRAALVSAAVTGKIDVRGLAA